MVKSSLKKAAKVYLVGLKQDLSFVNTSTRNVIIPTNLRNRAIMHHFILYGIISRTKHHIFQTNIYYIENPTLTRRFSPLIKKNSIPHHSNQPSPTHPKYTHPRTQPWNPFQANPLSGCRPKHWVNWQNRENRIMLIIQPWSRLYFCYFGLKSNWAVGALP
jgi:hypothetical protein